MSDHLHNVAGEPVSPDAPQFAVATANPRRLEIVAGLTFFGALLAFLGFGAAFWRNADNEILGGTLGLGFLLFGVAMVIWGKYLTPRGPFSEPRPLMETTQLEHDELVADFASRGRVAFGRRKFLGAMITASGAVFGVVALFPLVRSLGPLPKRTFYSTKWRKGSYVATIDGRRLKATDLVTGTLATVFPEDDLGGAISQTVLIRVQDSGAVTTKPGRESWGPEGFLAFSKVCTHAGCPVGLYEQTTKQLLCPCHQSLFDVTTGATPIFGPAPRPLPQLPLFVDSEGYLRAQGDYDEPVGPGFWERGGTN
jgi:ubiquinol-cytochrome c reductase iron-sulfur subunit